jgi:plasmid stabilization system protein ParE
MGTAAAKPEGGRLRQYRSAPFLMVPARQHFLIYDIVPQGIVVLTVQHQVRDIGSLIAELGRNFHAEVERLKRQA